ncbi:acyl-CoA N-acyltransferase [Cercophora newfieldiana]|uniref:Acyl-CoA N-acyltransferase n=1 Tax=Cercophora newfieldiana TaxID=92897 RepID=A0AA39YC72_9PEZI|nr:acyl-CoA N-acyltransferase [Cercophora newfieldiana]
MAPQIIYLPDGQTITVTPVFAGLFFKSNDLSTHSNAFPVGWTIVIHTEDSEEEGEKPGSSGSAKSGETRPHVHSYTKPTLHHDSLFISSVSNPSSSDFKPAASPSRQMAMMLWATLYWYFHQPAPATKLTTDASKHTPHAGRPTGEWRVRIKRSGVLRGRNLLPKLERMGLIASLDSSVGVSLSGEGEAWDDMFVSQRMFWQIPGRLFLFSLQPNIKSYGSHPGSPSSSRPGSPSVNEMGMHSPLTHLDLLDPQGPVPPLSLTSMPSFPIGPYFSASHLPTYYPPPPLQYTITNNIRHPVRPKPPRMGEVFYTRFVPSVGQYLAFRVASLATEPVPYMGPLGPKPPTPLNYKPLADVDLLQKWYSNPRVSAFWGKYAADNLQKALKSRHSFPVIGMWDGVPFGYFELYWVKEDILGQYIGGVAADDWDRGVHVLIGEEWARGRVQSWLTSLAQWTFNSDYRTMSLSLEPRVDNARFIQHLEFAGFTKEKEISFPHKQAWFGRLRRENWDGPSL